MREYFERIITCPSKQYYKVMSKYLDNSTKKFILTANPEMLKIALKNQKLNNAILNKENDVIADGILIVRASRHYGINIEERITGFDTAIELLKLGNQKKKTIYLYGAEKKVLNNVIKKINKEYPALKIIGSCDGFVKDKSKIMKEIINLHPDICLVALGIPKQEEFICDVIDKVDKGIFIGVGGTFDVISGYKKRAPKIFIKLNLEWLYRIVTEPKRIKRFYQNNIKFLFYVLRDKK